MKWHPTVRRGMRPTYPKESRASARYVGQLQTCPEGAEAHIGAVGVDLGRGHHVFHLSRLDDQLEPGRRAIATVPVLDADVAGVRVCEYVLYGKHLAEAAARLVARDVEGLADPVRVGRDVGEVGEVGLNEVREGIVLVIDGGGVAALAIGRDDGRERDQGGAERRHDEGGTRGGGEARVRREQPRRWLAARHCACYSPAVLSVERDAHETGRSFQGGPAGACVCV